MGVASNMSKCVIGRGILEIGNLVNNGAATREVVAMLCQK